MKTINTNSKAFKAVYFKYILDCIEFEDFDPKNDKEKMELFWVEFDQSFNNDYEKRNNPTLQNRVASYLAGQPHNFLVWDDDIVNLAIEQGSLEPNPTDKRRRLIIDNYYNFTAFKIIQLSQSLGIDTSLFA
jgi:hypothetical protein